MSKKYTFALDQSTNITGWAVFDKQQLLDCGAYSAKGDFPDRILKLEDWFDEAIQKYPKEDTLVVIEGIQMQRGNVDTYRRLAYAQAALVFYCIKNGLDYIVVYAAEWKKTCGVKGRTRVEQKANASKFVFSHFDILKIYDENTIQDIVDAICLGWHAINIANISAF